MGASDFRAIRAASAHGPAIAPAAAAAPENAAVAADVHASAEVVVVAVRTRADSAVVLIVVDVQYISAVPFVAAVQFPSSAAVLRSGNTVHSLAAFAYSVVVAYTHPTVPVEPVARVLVIACVYHDEDLHKLRGRAAASTLNIVEEDSLRADRDAVACTLARL